MTRDDIIRMAREAEFPVFDAKVTATNSLDQVIAETVTNHYHEGAIRFAALVAAAEREAIAQMIEDAHPLVDFAKNELDGCVVCGFTPKLAASTIRARNS